MHLVTAPIINWCLDLLLLLLQEPSIYRLYEAIMHNGEAIKSLINEEFGDGIMSAIDFYCTVDRMEGAQGERRVVITFNGRADMCACPWQAAP